MRTYAYVVAFEHISLALEQKKEAEWEYGGPWLALPCMADQQDDSNEQRTEKRQYVQQETTPDLSVRGKSLTRKMRIRP